jgi:lambda repressor-like predicted transcriptional regulator
LITAESAALQKYHLVNLLGEVNDETITLFKDGRLISNLKRLLMLNESYVNEINLSDRTKTEISLKQYPRAEHNALKTLLYVIGIQPNLTQKRPFTREDIERAYDFIAARPEAAILERAGWCSFKHRPKQFVTWISRLLRKMGVSLRSVSRTGGLNRNLRLYTICETDIYSSDQKQRKKLGVQTLQTLAARYRTYQWELECAHRKRVSPSSSDKRDYYANWSVLANPWPKKSFGLLDWYIEQTKGKPPD